MVKKSAHSQPSQIVIALETDNPNNPLRLQLGTGSTGRGAVLIIAGKKNVSEGAYRDLHHAIAALSILY